MQSFAQEPKGKDGKDINDEDDLEKLKKLLKKLKAAASELAATLENMTAAEAIDYLEGLVTTPEGRERLYSFLGASAQLCRILGIPGAEVIAGIIDIAKNWDGASWLGQIGMLADLAVDVAKLLGPGGVLSAIQSGAKIVNLATNAEAIAELTSSLDNLEAGLKGLAAAAAMHRATGKIKSKLNFIDGYKENNVRLSNYVERSAKLVHPQHVDDQKSFYSEVMKLNDTRYSTQIRGSYKINFQLGNNELPSLLGIKPGTLKKMEWIGPKGTTWHYYQGYANDGKLIISQPKPIYR